MSTRQGGQAGRGRDSRVLRVRVVHPLGVELLDALDPALRNDSLGLVGLALAARLLRMLRRAVIPGAFRDRLRLGDWGGFTFTRHGGIR